MMIILTLPNCLQWPFFNKVYCHFTGNIYRNVRNKTNPLENVGKKLEQDVADDEKIMQLRSSLCLHQLYSLAFRIISILAGSAYLLPLIEDDYQDYFSYMCKLIQIRHKQCHTSKVRFVFSSGCNKDLQFLLRRFLCHANIYVCEI